MEKDNVWPPGKTCGVVVTVNLDAESVDIPEAGPGNMYGRFLYGRYGMRAGVWRLLDVFRAHRVPVTFFVPGLDAENHPLVIEAIVRDGHEVAARGYAYENHGTLGGEERRTLERAHESLTRVVGVAPRGWRAPYGALSHDTLGHLADIGYLYDSSFQDDDYPYVVETRSGEHIVELPTFQFLDDSTFYNPRHSHIRALKVWKEEFDAMYAEGHFVNVTLHPRGDYGSGRAMRARAVDDFLQYIARHPGTYFTTCTEIAMWWKSAHPKTEPVGAGIAPFDPSLARG